MRVVEEEKPDTEMNKCSPVTEFISEPEAWPPAKGEVCTSSVPEGATGCPAAEKFSRNIQASLR